MELNGRFIGKKPIVVMLHIKKEQRRMHKQIMKETIGPLPHQGPNSGGYQLQQYHIKQVEGIYQQGQGAGYEQSYKQNFDPSSLLGMRNGSSGYESRPNRRPGGGDGGRYDVWRGAGPGQGSFQRGHVIGAEYESHPTGSTSNMEYQQHVRKHQQELHAQELLREEYRMRSRQGERKKSIPQESGLYIDQKQGFRSFDMMSSLQVPTFGYQRSQQGQEQNGFNPHIQQQQQQHPAQQQRYPIMPQQNQNLDAYDYSNHNAPRCPPLPEYGLGSSISSKVIANRNDSHLSQSSGLTSPKYNTEFEQSLRLLSIQKNELHLQNTSLNLISNNTQNQNINQMKNQSINRFQNGGSSTEIAPGFVLGHHHREIERRLHAPDGSRHLNSGEISPGLRSPGIRSLESSTHGHRSLESSTHGHRSLESSTHGHESLSHEPNIQGLLLNDGTDREELIYNEDFVRNRVNSLDNFSIQIKNNLTNGNNGYNDNFLNSECFESYYPIGGNSLLSMGNVVNTSTSSLVIGSNGGLLGGNNGILGGISGHSHHSSMIGTSSNHSYQSTLVSSRSSSIGNEEECRDSSISPTKDQSFATSASAAINELSDCVNMRTSDKAVSGFGLAPKDDQLNLFEKLLPLIEPFKPFLAKSITEYLIENADSNELLQLIDTPDLLLPHYIGVALSMMTVNSNSSSSSVTTVATSAPVFVSTKTSEET